MSMTANGIFTFNEDELSGAIISDTKLTLRNPSITVMANRAGDQLFAAFVSSRGNAMHPTGIALELFGPSGAKLKSTTDYSYGNGALCLVVEQPGKYTIKLSGSTNENCRFIVSRIGKGFSRNSYVPTANFKEYQNLLHSNDAHKGATKANLQFKLPSLCEVALYTGFTALVGLLLLVPGAQEEEAAMIAARAAGSEVLHAVQSKVAAWLLENAAVVVARLASLIGVSGSTAANLLAGVLGLDAGPAISAICG